MENNSFDIKPLDLEDRKMLLKWNRDVELKSLIGGVFSASELEHHKWFESKCFSHSEKMWMIYNTEKNFSIGAVGLKNIDLINRNAEFYIYIGEKEFLGKNIGTLITKKVLKLAFLNLNLHKVYLQVFSNNPRAITSYEKVGFVKEGCLKESIFIDGVYYDKIFMSVFKGAIL
ncbi:GNAT family protein [Planococcus sp. N064]|uniref:GNAT family protein n=1 Tax=Planococcus liqunii TaxID=3058394 RepID=A0ABT8MNF7_9BACL|nr:GNAT family protein [Planococcus sp. N064]MDN7226437.1 GNAT family protein [Planococcus sp. N064]